MEKNKIQFKPLHEGMGFHPFSDGLPYAPESKTKYGNGAGATSAGRPKFAEPIDRTAAMAPATSTSPRVTARQLQERKTNPSPQATLSHASLPVTHHEPLARGVAPTKKNEQKSEIKVATTPQSESILLRRRAFAYLMDTLIHAGFWLTTNLAALFFFKFQLDSEIIKENLGQFLVFFLISQWLFIALQEILFENSIGKAFFNLEFKRNHHSLFLRSVVFVLGVLCLGLGFYFRPQDRLGEIQLRSRHYA
jgi:hypothetical protein